MLRALYLIAIRLHPRAFRSRFEREMVAIFDEIVDSEGASGLLVDATTSLLRQWLLRPESRSQARVSIVPASAPVPLLASLEAKPLHPSAVVGGAALSIVLVWIMALAGTGRTELKALWFGTHRSALSVVPARRSSFQPAEPKTLVTLGKGAEDPWKAIAAVYFRLIPLLKALDRDEDLVVSSWEIVTAQSALMRLDRNGDGKLDAEECGFSLGPRVPAGFNSVQARKAFMRAQPILAALDLDHNGEISATEIANRSRSLRSLDTNGDGLLEPREVMPEGAGEKAAAMLLQLDTDFDGRISPSERRRAGTAILTELLARADRDVDSFVTPEELTREIRIREEALRQAQEALVGVVPAGAAQRVQ